MLADGNRLGGGLTDAMIANVVSVDKATSEHVRKRFVLEGMEEAIERNDQENRKPRLLDGAGETMLVKLTCSEPPDGYSE